MRTITKQQLLFLLFSILLVLFLPFVVYLTRQRQDIRPRALQGKANLLLSSTNMSPMVGEYFHVWVSLQLTDPTLKLSGADFLLLYDKEKLAVTNATPEIVVVNPQAKFDEAPIVTFGGSFNDKYNYVRVSVISTRANSNLHTGTTAAVNLAKITFYAAKEGSADIRFPDDNGLIEIVGTGIYVPPTAVPTGLGNEPPFTTSTVSTPTPTGSPTRTPTPTLPPGVIINSASGQSCTTACTAFGGKICADVGLDGFAGDNSRYSYFSDPAHPEQNHCDLIGFGTTCSTVMTDRLQTIPPTCGGYKSDWTKCKCVTPTP